MSIFPAEVADKFEYVDQINFGSYGAVFKVKRKQDKYYLFSQIFAMKVVAINPGDKKSLKNVEIETKIISELKNPYLIQAVFCTKVDNKVYMVIDYCEKGDLLKFICDRIGDSRPFSEELIWKYFIQICFGLECLHANQIIHRDIKPENILLDWRYNIKIGDFGLSRYLAASSVDGTSFYYSPRMLDGHPPNSKCDIWALGCVLYYLCNFKHPFKGNIMKAKTEQPKPLRAQYSNELKSVVDWCLKKEESQRPTINQILSIEFIASKAKSLWLNIPFNSTLIKNIKSLTIEELRAKTSAIMEKTDNSPEIDKEFRNVVFDYEFSDNKSALREAYKEYIKAYYHISALYCCNTMCSPIGWQVIRNWNVHWEIRDTNMISTRLYSKFYMERRGILIGGSENEHAVTKIPGGIFISTYGQNVIYDNNFNARELPPSKVKCWYPSAIYFNRSIYRFGGLNGFINKLLTLSEKFDLDEDRWIDLAPLPEAMYHCHSLIHKGNILIAGVGSRNILRYSINGNSFSAIPYNFLGGTKILAKAEKLYLFGAQGFIYESEIEDESTWKNIGSSDFIENGQPHCTISNGVIMIGISDYGRYYTYEFNLNQKRLSKNITNATLISF